MGSIIAHPTRNQTAIAATVTWAALLFRRMIERQEIKPVNFQNKTSQTLDEIPFYIVQYE